MKKVVLFFAVAAAFAFASCTETAKQTTNEVADVVDSTVAAVDSAVAVVDSAATAVAEAVAE